MECSLSQCKEATTGTWWTDRTSLIACTSFPDISKESMVAGENEETIDENDSFEGMRENEKSEGRRRMVRETWFSETACYLCFKKLRRSHTPQPRTQKGRKHRRRESGGDAMLSLVAFQAFFSFSFLSFFLFFILSFFPSLLKQAKENPKGHIYLYSVVLI